MIQASVSTVHRYTYRFSKGCIEMVLTMLHCSGQRSSNCFQGSEAHSLSFIHYHSLSLIISFTIIHYQLSIIINQYHSFLHSVSQSVNNLHQNRASTLIRLISFVWCRFMQFRTSPHTTTIPSSPRSWFQMERYQW